MMYAQTLEDQGHEILNEIWESEVSADVDVRQCSAYHVIDRLLRLLDQAHEMSADHLESTVRIILQEQSYTEESTDSAPESVDLDRQVAVLIIVLESLRQLQIKQGHWSEEPTTPIMFG